MIAFLSVIVILAVLCAARRKKCTKMPTDQEVNDLTNHLNRMALKRGNK